MHRLGFFVGFLILRNRKTCEIQLTLAFLASSFVVSGVSIEPPEVCAFTLPTREKQRICAVGASFILNFLLQFQGFRNRVAHGS